VRLQPLVQLANAAAALSPGRRIVIAGSSAILGSFPEIGEGPGPLENSFDADLLVEGVDAALAAVLEESIGRGSSYQEREGYYADTMRPVVSETFPRGWEERLVPLPGCEAARCLDPHDLAAVKMQAGRAKDLALCAALLAKGKLKVELIRNRLQETRMPDRMRVLSDERLKQAIEMAKHRGG
jgi:hypothetical protein